MESFTLFGISTMAYIIAMVIYIAFIAFRNSMVGIAATTLTIIGFVSQTVAFFIRWGESYDQWVMLHPGSELIMSMVRSAPLRNLYESLEFFVWCLILVYLIIEFKYKNRSFGAFVTPVAGLALAFIDLSGMSKEIQPLIPALQSNWLLAHVIMSFIAYATFALSFSTGLMYLILKTEKRTEPSYIFWTLTSGIFLVVLIAMGLDYMTYGVGIKSPDALIKNYLFKASFLSPSSGISVLSWIAAIAFIFVTWRYGYLLKKVLSSLSLSTDMLDEITYKSIAVGFPVFTLGGLIFGAIWADQAWGTYWGWDPKETWSLITWFVYAFFIHSRLLRGWRGNKVAVVAVIGFAAVIFTYLGVNLLLSGLHAYGGLE